MSAPPPARRKRKPVDKFAAKVRKWVESGGFGLEDTHFVLTLNFDGLCDLLEAWEDAERQHWIHVLNQADSAEEKKAARLRERSLKK
jgi:hypothetical protein